MSPEVRPTAVVCSTDRLALSLMAALRMHQIGVPEDVSVLGCDDIAAAAEAAVPLTTLRQPMQKVAEAIWELLEKKLQGGAEDSAGAPVPAIFIPPELIVRQSTRAIAVC
jgi:LacI family transcriptional regulator